jgi:2-oxoglutarate ferredoxin oxidoreductase subunit gamma
MSAQGIVDREGRMSKTPRFEIRIAGFGGQGVVTIGRILGEAFTIYEGKNSVNTHSYGPESRGGACKSEVVVSDGEIHYPNVRKADLLIALSQVGLDTYISDLKEGGIVLVDPRSVKNVPDRDKYRVHEVPTMDIAHEIGGVKFQNSVALGALYPLIAHMIKESSLRQGISNNVPSETVEINMEAFKRGMRYAKEGKAK